jgi:hypothetical protein
MTVQDNQGNNKCNNGTKGHSYNSIQGHWYVVQGHFCNTMAKDAPHMDGSKRCSLLTLMHTEYVKNVSKLKMCTAQ